MKTKLQNQTEKIYSVKPQDFIPFAGPFIYQVRNWKDENGKLKRPQPYNEYSNIGIGLIGFNLVTSFASIYAAFRGLEALLK